MRLTVVLAVTTAIAVGVAWRVGRVGPDRPAVGWRVLSFVVTDFALLVVAYLLLGLAQRA
ncbi:MAG TPA: hypothetical protein VEJ44_03585 [Acidimicrobiales bacterium]|nr:hypothetical protein [Acidimicrobiales bacterium]